mmetsp:Transcript_23284/g.45410  ORF Transcript_23284/g.45410 Transcript_23284/m.45410 type:complete len:332 (+) Transcript_23284:287-1282(+)
MHIDDDGAAAAAAALFRVIPPCDTNRCDLTHVGGRTLVASAPNITIATILLGTALTVFLLGCSFSSACRALVRSTEAGEIMGALEKRRGTLHGLDVQGLFDMPYQFAAKNCSCRVVVDGVTVVLFSAAVPWVKRQWGQSSVHDDDVFRQVLVQPNDEGLDIRVLSPSEGYDLAPRMDALVRSRTRHQSNRPSQGSRHGYLHGILNGRRVRLRLEAIVPTPIVRHGQDDGGVRRRFFRCLRVGVGAAGRRRRRRRRRRKPAVVVHYNALLGLVRGPVETCERLKRTPLLISDSLPHRSESVLYGVHPLRFTQTFLFLLSLSRDDPRPHMPKI